MTSDWGHLGPGCHLPAPAGNPNGLPSWPSGLSENPKGLRLTRNLGVRAARGPPWELGREEDSHQALPGSQPTCGPALTLCLAQEVTP